MRAESGELSAEGMSKSRYVDWVPLEELTTRLAYADERRLMAQVPELLADAG